MKRGEVWWVDFEPSSGGEARKVRPAVIVSNNASNRFLNRVQVVPLTSQVGKIYPSEFEVQVAGQPGKAKADQVTTADKARLKKRLGALSPLEMAGVENALRVQLGLDLF